jgi:hypothetical protein
MKCMTRVSPIKILLQTTIPATADDWSIARFSHLTALLEQARSPEGDPLFEVTARDRDPPGAPDSVLSRLDDSDYDELWLFAVDTGDGLAHEDCQALSRFRRRGGGLMVTRDHMDLGCSVCDLADVGKAHHFHTHNLDPTVENRAIDDTFTREISWPNYHSGANGDFQAIAPAQPLHPVLQDADAPEGRIRFLPSHPHEGSVDAPPGVGARVIAYGTSKVTGRRFNLAVAFEAGEGGGRAIAQSTFHHFADYNWDLAAGCPSFVSEAPGHAMAATPEALASTHRYALNVATWLANRDV